MPIMHLLDDGRRRSMRGCLHSNASGTRMGHCFPKVLLCLFFAGFCRRKAVMRPRSHVSSTRERIGVSCSAFAILFAMNPSSRQASSLARHVFVHQHAAFFRRLRQNRYHEIALLASSFGIGRIWSRSRSMFMKLKP